MFGFAICMNFPPFLKGVKKKKKRIKAKYSTYNCWSLPEHTSLARFSSAQISTLWASGCELESAENKAQSGLQPGDLTNFSISQLHYWGNSSWCQHREGGKRNWMHREETGRGGAPTILLQLLWQVHGCPGQHGRGGGLVPAELNSSDTPAWLLLWHCDSPPRKWPWKWNRDFHCLVSSPGLDRASQHDKILLLKPGISQHHKVLLLKLGIFFNSIF